MVGFGVLPGRERPPVADHVIEAPPAAISSTSRGDGDDL